MKNRISRRQFLSVLGAAAATAVLTACGGSSAASASAASAATPAASAGSGSVTTYTVAVSGQTAPFNYYSENGELDGYEIAILKEIDSRLPDLQFTYTTTEFASLFAGLDSGQFDLVANNMTSKPERREKYLFSENAYYYNHTIIVTNADTTDLTTLDDLAGHTIPVSAGSATDVFLQDYNEKNPDKAIPMEYVEGNLSQCLVALYEGRYDAMISAESYVDAVEKSYGYQFNHYPIPNEKDIQDPAAYFLFSKTGTALQQQVDAVLSEMKQDGTLSQLCVQYFGKDATQETA